MMPSVQGAQERLPAAPLSGMNFSSKLGGKVRLIFKLEQGQLWIGTEEGTEKLPMGSIKNVVTEPIEGPPRGLPHDGVSVGPHGNLLLWGVLGTNSICGCKDTVLGKWQYF